MSFISLDYLFLYLPAVVGLYLVFRKTVFANVIIVLASYLFYAVAAAWYLVPLILTSVLDFVVGGLLARQGHPRRRRALLIASLAANLGVLAFFKYATWFIDGLDLGLVAIGIGAVVPTLAVPLPPGISFYTFQSMSYTIELYRRDMKPARSFLDYITFVAFWPHLVAGPIMRASNLLRQLEHVRPVISADEIRYALMLIVWGVFKKVVLADNFAYLTDSIDGYYRYGTGFPGAGLLFAYAFAGQIYCDFSAYTDIARGSAKLVGVDLIRNFNTPYFAASPTEFWRRWHISLSTWLRDYLYIPLGGNRHGRFMEYRNIMITMVLGGLWHGAGVLFLLWGVWHGLMLVLHRLVPFDRYMVARFGRAGKWLAILITFHIVCVGWILFRARTEAIIPMLWSIPAMFDVARFDVRHFLAFSWGIAVLGAVTALTDYLGYRKGGEFTDLFKVFNPYACAALACACYFGLVIFGKRDGGQFIYFQF